MASTFDSTPQYDGEFPEVDGGTFGLPWHEPKEFHIHFKAGKAADYVSERIWADKQKIEMQDDNIFMGSKPTGRRFFASVMNFYYFNKDGKIINDIAAEGMIAILRQIGLVNY